MYSRKGIPVLGLICAFCVLCTSAESLVHEQLGNGYALQSISEDKQSEDLFASLLVNIQEGSRIDNEFVDNISQNGEESDRLPSYVEKGLHKIFGQFQKLLTNCTVNSFITKDGNCELCQQCSPHEVLISLCTLIRDTVCKPLDQTQLSSRCVDLFKRKHNQYLLKKYWILSEKWHHHWVRKCFSFLTNFSLQKKAQVIKLVHKRQADPDKIPEEDKNILEKGSNSSVKQKSGKISFRKSNISTTPRQFKHSQGDSTGTAPWVFITIGVAAVFLITLLSTLAIIYKRKMLRRRKSPGKNKAKECHADIMSIDMTTKKSMFTLSGRGEDTPDDVYCHELLPLKSISAREELLGEDYLGSDYYVHETEYNYLPIVQVSKRLCEPQSDVGHSLLRSCLSPCEEEDSVKRAPSTSSFFSSRKDDGNKLRGGNGDFQRRYVDVDYVHNNIDLQRRKGQNRNSSDLEQGYSGRAYSQRKSVPHSPELEQRWKTSTNRSSSERGRNGSNTSSSARSYISIPPTSPSENYIEAGSSDASMRSERSTPPFKIAWLTKNLKVDAKNELRNYQSSLGTQTENDNDITAPNCKTVFGTSWQFGGTFTSRGGKLQAKDSDVCLVVVANAVAKGDYVDIYGAVFTDTTEIRKKLDFPARESLITPVVEYHAVPVKQFCHHVCVQLPHAMPEDFDDNLIKVYTFTVDERGKVSLYDVPAYGKANDDRSLATYWEKGSDGCSIHISTTHFSGYFCTLCETSSLPSICTMVFGSHVQITSSRREVRVILYIWDRRLTIKDYFERFRKQESDVDRQLLTDMQIPLLDNASSDSRLVMKMEVMGEDEDRQSWRHVSRSNDSRPLFKPLQVRKLSEIVHCCRQTDPIRVEWALENAPRQIPSAIFQCCIDIMHVHESTRDYETAMREGSDDLMRTFYVRDLKVIPHNSQELKPQAEIQLADLKRVLLETTDMAQTERMCQEFGIAVKDIGNFKKKYSSVEAFQTGLVEECLRRHGLDKFMNLLPDILQRLHLSHVLTVLEKWQVSSRPVYTELPSPSKTVSHVKKPAERVIDTDIENTRCKSPYRRRSSSPSQRNRSNSPMYRRSREDRKGNQRPDLQQQMSERSDDVFVLNNPTHQQSAINDHCSRSSRRDKGSRQQRRHRHNSSSSNCSEDDEENFIESQNIKQNRGQNIGQRQPVKNQKSSSSRGDSVLSSNSILSADTIVASSYFPSRSTLDPSMVAHADPKDFAEPYPDEFLDSYLQETYKKELAIQKNLYGPYSSSEYAPYQNIRDGPHLSDSGPQAISADSREMNVSSISDPVPPYQKLSDNQRSCEKSQSQERDHTLKKELYGVSTVV